MKTSMVPSAKNVPVVSSWMSAFRPMYVVNPFAPLMEIAWEMLNLPVVSASICGRAILVLNVWRLDRNVISAKKIVIYIFALEMVFVMVCM